MVLPLMPCQLSTGCSPEWELREDSNWYQQSCEDGSIWNLTPGFKSCLFSCAVTELASLWTELASLCSVIKKGIMFLTCLRRLFED